MKPELSISQQSLEEFFRERLLIALGNHKLAVQELTEYYLVNLLTEYALTANIFDSNEWGNDHEPLALMFDRANNSPLTTKINLYKKLGDISLYFSGFFGDAIERKLVSIDYYIRMGMAAYLQLQSLLSYTTKDRSFQEIFHELGQNFSALVRVFEEISEFGPLKEQDIVQLFERWKKRKDPKSFDALSSKGVIPTDSVPLKKIIN